MAEWPLTRDCGTKALWEAASTRVHRKDFTSFVQVASSSPHRQLCLLRCLHCPVACGDPLPRDNVYG